MAYYQHLKVLKNDHVSEKMGPEFLNTESFTGSSGKEAGGKRDFCEG